MEVSRRTLLQTGLLSALGLATAARAAVQQSSPYTVEYGIPNMNFYTSRQHCPQWCWAASIETLYKLWGFAVDQEQIVAQAYGPTAHGGLVCSPASDALMLQALTRTYIDGRGIACRGAAVPIRSEWSQYDDMTTWGAIASELANNRPLLAGYNSGSSGHAVIITHIQVTADGYGSSRVSAVTVRDPWPGSLNRRVLSLQEAMGLNFIAAVQIGRA